MVWGVDNVLVFSYFDCVQIMQFLPKTKGQFQIWIIILQLEIPSPPPQHKRQFLTQSDKWITGTQVYFRLIMDNAQLFLRSWKHEINTSESEAWHFIKARQKNVFIRTWGNPWFQKVRICLLKSCRRFLGTHKICKNGQENIYTCNLSLDFPDTS